MKRRTVIKKPMVTVYVQLQPALRAAAKRQAKVLGITLGQLILLAIEKNLGKLEGGNGR